ncbi:MAG: phage antirepressor KilAC domain-containing protein [Clostridiales bacterium]|nr:phage antirepressor KilAC domain-containing protein [Clostridiales bacterium]
MDADKEALNELIAIKNMNGVMYVSGGAVENIDYKRIEIPTMGTRKKYDHILTPETAINLLPIYNVTAKIEELREYLESLCEDTRKEIQVIPVVKQPLKSIEEELQDKDGQIVVSSRDVAVRFGKRHADVIRAVEDMINKTGVYKNLFVKSRYQHPQNKRWYPEYLLTYNGFVLLTMSFTGAEMAQYKSSVNEIFEELSYTNHVNVTNEPKKSINEIINIKEENGEILISGRELHEFLEIGTPYAKWFVRMCEYGFEENQDFITVGQKCPIANGGYQERVDHAIKIDMAKEIAMLQRNEKGKEARKYFIDCEKKLKVQQPALPITYKDALIALVAEVEAKERLQLEVKAKEEAIQEMKPKADFCEEVLEADGAVPINIIAKDYGMSARSMNRLLHQLKVQYPSGGTWVLYAKYQDQGYTTTETGTKDTRFGEYAYVTTKWTQKGRMFIYEKLKE